MFAPDFLFVCVCLCVILLISISMNVADYLLLLLLWRSWSIVAKEEKENVKALSK